MAVKIKLKRMGKIREPYYRIVVADARKKRDGRAIEEIGKYHPKADPSFIEVNSDRAQHWLSVGAQPTDPVRKLLEVTGDWQRFKGLPGAEGTLKTAAPRSDKKEIFAAALAETLAQSAAAPKGKAKSGGAKAGEAKAGDGKAEKAPKGGKAESGKAKASGKAESGKAESGEAKAAEAESGEAKAAEAESAEPAGQSAEATAAGSEAGASVEPGSEAGASVEPGSGD